MIKSRFFSLCALQCNVWGGDQLSCHPWADRRLLITNEFPNPLAPRFIPVACRQLLITCSRSHWCCWEWEWSSCWTELRAASRSENDSLVVHLLTTHAAAADALAHDALAHNTHNHYCFSWTCSIPIFLLFMLLQMPWVQIETFLSSKLCQLIASIVKTHSNLVFCKTFARHSFHKHNIWPGMSEKVVIVLVCLPCGSSSSAPCNLTLSRHEYAPRGNLESLARGKIVK